MFIHACKSVARNTLDVDTYQEQPALITARIQQLDNIKTAEKVLSDCGSFMNVVNLTAFLSQLAKICKQERLVSHIQSFPTTIETAEDDDTARADAPLKDLDASAWDDDASVRKASRNKYRQQATNPNEEDSKAKLDSRTERLRLLRITEKALKLLRPLLMEMDSQGFVIVLNALARMNARYTITHDLLYLSMTFMDEYDARVSELCLYMRTSMKVLAFACLAKRLQLAITPGRRERLNLVRFQTNQQKINHLPYR